MSAVVWFPVPMTSRPRPSLVRSSAGRPRGWETREIAQMITSTKRRPSLPGTARYEYGEPIGQGGAGTVYRALDRHTGEPVAIKVLAARLSENLTLHRRLAVEFQAARALEHPNIVRAIAAEMDGEVSFLVYELVEGGSLGERIEQHGPLPEDEVI